MKEQVRHLKNLFLAVSNLPTDEEEPDLPDDLTVEKMVTVVTAFFKASNNVIETVVQELHAKVRKNCTSPLLPPPSRKCLVKRGSGWSKKKCSARAIPYRVAQIQQSFDACRVFCRSFQGEDISNPETAMKMSMAIQERNGPATDEAIKRFNLNSTVRPVPDFADSV